MRGTLASGTAQVLAEDHTCYIDFGGMYRVRRVFLEFGRRFAAAGLLARAADVAYLTLDEIRATLTPRSAVDRRVLVACRRAEMAYWARVTPPPTVGAAGGSACGRPSGCT